MSIQRQRLHAFWSVWRWSISVWIALYLDPCCEASGTKTRLFSLDRGIQKPGMALTLRNSVYLMLKTKTLIEILIEWVTCQSKWFLLYLGRYWGYPPEPGSCFYRQDIVFPIPSLYRTGGACMFITRRCLHAFWSVWRWAIFVWLELYLDPCCATSDTKTRLFSLDRGIQKPGMVLTLRNSVYLMLKSKTLIETLIGWVQWHSKWFRLYLGRYWGYLPEPGSCFYRQDLVFPIPSLYTTGGARMSIQRRCLRAF